MSLTIPPTSGLTITPSDGGYSPYYFVPDVTPKDANGLHLPYSLDFYIYVESGSGLGYVISNSVNYSTSSTYGMMLQIREGQSDYAYRFGFDRSWTYNTYQETFDKTDTWVHIEITFDGSDHRLYEDGVEKLVLSKASVSKPVASAYHGGMYGDTTPGKTIANIRQWDHARTPAQVADDMVTDYAPGEPGLLSAHRMDSGLYYEADQLGGLDAMLLNHTEDPDLSPASVAIPLPSISDRFRDPNSDYKLHLVGQEVAAASEPVHEGQISGTVTVKGDPASQRVMALVRSTGQKVAETTSAEDGTYTLTGLDPDVAHVIVALDKNLEYNGVIADNITPEVPA